jgi:hypothetical protein
MVSEPVGEFAAIEPPSREIEYETLLGIDGGIDLRAVEYQECLHGGMPDALVTINEGVSLNQRQTQSRSLLGESGIQSLPPNVALGWATADSSAPKSRTPGAPPVAWRRRRCSSTTSPSVT